MKTKVSVLGIDIGKNICSLVGLDAAGTVVMRRRATRETLIGLAANLPACVVAWRHAAALTIWGGSSRLMATRFG